MNIAKWLAQWRGPAPLASPSSSRAQSPSPTIPPERQLSAASYPACGIYPLSDAQRRYFRTQIELIDFERIKAGKKSELERAARIAADIATAMTGVAVDPVKVKLYGLPRFIYRAALDGRKRGLQFHEVLLGAVTAHALYLPAFREAAFNRAFKQALGSNRDDFVRKLLHETHHEAQRQVGFMNDPVRMKRDIALAEGHATWNTEHDTRLYPEVCPEDLLTNIAASKAEALAAAPPDVPLAQLWHLQKEAGLTQNYADGIALIKRVRLTHPALIDRAFHVPWVARLLLAREGTVEIPTPSDATREQLSHIKADVRQIVAFNPKGPKLRVVLNSGQAKTSIECV